MSLGLLPTLVSVALVASAGATEEATYLYVATDGDDTWSGRIDAPNATRDDGPLATLVAARDAIRRMRADGSRTPVTVWVQGGTYALGETFVLTPEDSGSAAAPITYAAYPNETPVFSGGVELTDWEATELDGRAVWRTRAPDGSRAGHQLFVDGDPFAGVYKGHSFYNGLVERLLTMPQWRARFVTMADRVAQEVMTPAFIKQQVDVAVCRMQPDLLADDHKRSDNDDYIKRVEQLHSFAVGRRKALQSLLKVP